MKRCARYMALSRMLCVSLIAFGPLALSAQAAGGELFSRLEGRWDGTGELFGRTAFFEMSWRIPFDGVAALDFSNGFVAADGQRTAVIQATALYRFAGEGSDGVWMDSRGERVMLGVGGRRDDPTDPLAKRRRGGAHRVFDRVDRRSARGRRSARCRGLASLRPGGVSPSPDSLAEVMRRFEWTSATPR